MSGSTAAPFYSLPYTPTMNSHLADSSYGSENNTYLTNSIGAGPSTQTNGNVNGENTPGSTKRPFPWASSESERDKRPRSGSGNVTATDDAEETMSTDESAYVSAAESPNPHFSRSPTRAEWPLSVVDESERASTSAPRIPTPAALRSSSPLQLPNLPQSGFRPVSPPTTTTTTNPPLRLALAPRPSSTTHNVTTEQPRTQPLDLGWLTQQLDEALPPHRDRAFSLSFGSASVDSALPLPQHSRAGSTRVPLPWVDIEGDSSLLGPGSLSASLGPESSLGLGESSASSPGVASTIRSEHSPPTTTAHSPPTATTRRPLSLNLRNFPLVPSPDSPASAFPTSASPRTSAFDLAVTPPGSALPSFVARMMEVDSPVHGGGDSYISSQAETYIPSDRTENYFPSPSRTEAYTSAPQPQPQPETYIPPPNQPESYTQSDEAYIASPPQAENDAASIDALGRFMRQDESNRVEFVRQSHVRQEQGSGFARQEQASGFTHQNEAGGFAHQDGASGFTHSTESARPIQQSGSAAASPSVSPNQAPTGVAVGSYFPAPEPHERQRVARRPLSMGGQFELLRHGHDHARNGSTEQVPRSGQIEQPSRNANSGQVPRSTHAEQVSRNSQPSREQDHARVQPSQDSSNTIGSIYSRRLTESGISFPSRPSDSGASLPSFRATVSPEPGRMSWSDLFASRTPGTPETGLSTRGSEVAMSARSEMGMSARSEAESSTRGSEATMSMRESGISVGTRTDTMAGTRVSEISRASDATTDARTEASRSTGADLGIGTRGGTDSGTSTSRAGVRSALTRAVRLSEGPPRLHLDSLPREDRAGATNLSRTPPAPDSHPAVWFEDSASRPRRTSSTRWTDLFPEPAAAPVPIVPRPTNRTRMPPPVSISSTDSTVFDPLTGMSWNRSSQAVPEPPSATYDAADSLARYQTFAQSIDEIRRSPPLPQQTAPPDSMGWGENGSNRSSWAFPRHEPLQYEPHPPPQTDGDWLREWESQRDRRSRAVREDYIRRRDTDYASNDRRHNAEYVSNDEAPRPPPLAQLNDTQAVWPDFMGRPRPRPRPMTRASLVATGFADSDLWPESDGSNNRLWGEIPPRPSRRAEVLPARTNDLDTPMQFLPNTHEGGIFTESPPSLVEDFSDSGPYPESISGIAQPPPPPPRPDPVNFRSASRVLRASLVDTSRRTSDGPSRSIPLAEPERTRVSSRERWEPPLSRSQVQLERVRQLLHRSSDSRDRESSRRHPPDSPAQPHRRSFLSPLDNEIPSSTISSDSRRSSMSDAPTTPLSLHEGDRPEWPLPDTSSRNNAPTHALMRASSLRGRRRRTLLPESASRRDSTGFLHSMNNALNQVESGLLHMNRELNALADEEGDHMRRYVPQNESEPMRPHSPARSGPHMDWAFEPTQRNPTPPPTLPPFEFVTAQRNSGWPAERYNHLSGETSGLGLDLPVEYPARRTPTRGPEYFEQRQSVRDSSSTRGTRASSYAHEGAWRSSGGPSNEWWSNDASSPNLPTHMPLRDRLLFRPSGSGHPSVAVPRQPEPVNSRGNNMGSSMQAQPPSATFGRLHRRRLSPPAPPHQPSVSSSLLRPFANQNNSSSPTRSYASRFSHFLPRRNSGRGSGGGGGGGSSDDNDEWHHAEQATRRFFLRPRGRTRPTPTNGDYMRDDEFDDSYEGLLRLAARIGEAKPRGTPSEVIRSMLSCRYADSPGARAEARCPICLDDYAPDDIVTVVKRCSHWFHRECVQQWLSNSRTCPVCRGQADGEDSEPQAGPSTGASDNSWM